MFTSLYSVRKSLYSVHTSLYSIFGALLAMIVTRLPTNIAGGKFENGGKDCNYDLELHFSNSSNLTEVFEKEKITPDVVPPLRASEMKRLCVNTMELYLRQNSTSEFNIQVSDLP